jgi:hypothetical protein
LNFNEKQIKFLKSYSFGRVATHHPKLAEEIINMIDNKKIKLDNDSNDVKTYDILLTNTTSVDFNDGVNLFL